MKNSAVFFFLFLAVVATLPLTIAAAPALPGEPCPVPPRAEWTDTEKWAWSEVCGGRTANLNTRPGAAQLDPAVGDGWTDDRVLRPAYLQTLLLHAPYRDSLGRQGVRIKGARIIEDLDFEDSRLDTALRIEESRFDGSVSFMRARARSVLSLANSSIGGTLYLDHGRYGGELVLRGSSVEGEIIARHARIDGNLNLTELMTGKRARFDALVIAGNLFLRRAKIGETLQIRETRIGKQLVASDGIFEKGLNFFGSRVERFADLRKSDFRAPLFLNYARFGNGLNLAETKLTRLYLTGATVANDFFLGSPRQAAPTWAEDGFIGLQNTTVGAIQDLPDSWPPRMEMAGFVYDRISGFTGATDTLGTRDEAWHRDWLARDTTYTPQPYRQLAEALQRAGRPLKAEAVLFASAERARRGLAADGEWLGWFWETLKLVFIGYGFRLWYAVFWIAGFVLLGAAIFQRTPEARELRSTTGIGYSLDTLLPIIRLRGAHEKIDFPNERRGVRYYFYFHKAMGWVLASFLAAGLAGFKGG